MVSGSGHLSLINMFIISYFDNFCKQGPHNDHFEAIEGHYCYTNKVNISTPLQSIKGVGPKSAEQFAAADRRPAGEVAARLRELGLDPVWKDWDRAILSP